MRKSLFLLVCIQLLGCGAEPDSSQKATEQSKVSFTEVSAVAGLGGFRHERGAAGNLWFPEINGSGGAFIDYDGDGWQDVLLAGGGVWKESGMEPVPGVWLYRNEGDGTFSLQTDAAGLTGINSYTYGFAAADYDNDGDQDLYVTTVEQNRLFRNEGGHFVDVPSEAGSEGPSEWSNSAAFFDADRDGLLDLFVTNYVAWTPESDLPCLFGADNRKDYCTPHAYQGTPPRYYHNEGAAGFVDRTDEAGFGVSTGKSMGVVLLDYNQDRWIDLAVSNDGEPDHLFRNEGDGTFTDVGFVSGMALNSRGQPQAGMGIDAGDIDGSGLDAIVVGNFANETIGVFQYDGNALFVDRANASGIGAASMPLLTFGVMMFDADLDGDLDVFTANGHISLFADEDDDQITLRQRPHLFLNSGDGTFRDAAGGSEALATPRLARGTAYADYDRDGDLDVLLTENGGPVALYRNETRAEGSGPHWLRVMLRGSASNRDGIGADLRLYAGGRLQRRYVRSGSSFLSQSELPVTFGLGNTATADSLVVLWPSGARQVHRDVTASAEYLVTEQGDRLSALR